MKPYRTIPIEECGDPLIAIPKGLFVLQDPHVYMAAGAPYNMFSPWMLREKTLSALIAAQNALQKQRPGWKILVFDAFRPNAVQAYMVEREFRIQAAKNGLDPQGLTPQQREELGVAVFRLWGIPSEDPTTPPLHSTGGALDVSLVDTSGHEVDMGSPIDENSDRSYPDYFAGARDEKGQEAHRNRLLLRDLMWGQGFSDHLTEWWHYSLYDQYWAWRRREEGIDANAVALYGRAEGLRKR